MRQGPNGLARLLTNAALPVSSMGAAGRAMRPTRSLRINIRPHEILEWSGFEVITNLVAESEARGLTLDSMGDALINHT
jgi:hypothetical protein